jgi:tetratricopeptide (TPR) repeat protein
MMRVLRPILPTMHAHVPMTVPDPTKGVGAPADGCQAQVDALIDAAWRARHDDSRRALATARQALALAERTGYVRGRAWALLRVAVCELIVADPARACEQRLADSAVLMRELQDVAGEAEVMNLQAHLLGARGELSAAIALDRRCLALRRTLGDLAGQAGSLNNLAGKLLSQGCSDEALACLQDSLRLAGAAGDGPGTAYAHCGLGWLYLRLEQPAAAIGHFEAAFAHVARTADRALECTALTGLARALSLQGRHDDALTMLQHARALARRTGNAADTAGVHLALAVVHQGRGRHVAPAPHLHAALRVLRRTDDRALEAEVHLVLAIQRLAEGEPLQARAQIERLREAARHIGSPALLAQADWLALEVERA